MSNTHFIEDCLAITPKEVTAIATHGKHKKYPVDIDCWFDDIDTGLVSISVNKKEPQGITLEMVDIHFGQMTYFQCACGCRALKLYRPPHRTEFRCRQCQDLRYRVSTLNTNSPAGRAIYKADRINKLIETRESMERIFYRGQFTNKYTNFLVQCKRVGLHDVVERSKGLLGLVTQEISTKAGD